LGEAKSIRRKKMQYDPKTILHSVIQESYGGSTAVLVETLPALLNNEVLVANLIGVRSSCYLSEKSSGIKVEPT
jgi:hypothetical protein